VPLPTADYGVVILAESSTVIEPLTQFGLAGFMGAMWLWERHTSRKRESQIDDAHTRILSDRVLLDELITAVRTNVEAMTRLSTTQEQLIRELRRGKE
jgi:hypothetical protein